MLGLGEGEFWQLTLAQFIALLERYNENQARLQEREDYRAAVIASTFLNTIPRTRKNRYKVFTPADIFPGYGWGKKGDDSDNPEEKLNKALLTNAAYGGVVVEKVYGEGNS